MRASVIIVNFNGERLLPDCLDALEAQTCPAYEVIVLDNASSDGSRELINSVYPWVRLIESEENLGFAAANNLGIRSSSGEVVVLLNNDTAPSPGFIEEILRPFDEDRDLSAVAGVMLFSNNPDYVASTGIEVYENGLALEQGTGERWRELPQIAPVFGPTGGAAAFCRTVLNDVDLFPEPFFLYLEDVDLAWRLRLRGHRTVSSAAAWTYHVYSASAVEGSAFKDYYLARNRTWALIRCWPRAIWQQHWWSVLKYEIGALGYALLVRKWSSIRGRFDGWRAIWRLRRVRGKIQRRTTSSVDELIYWTRSDPTVRTVFRSRRIIQTMTGLDAGDACE